MEHKNSRALDSIAVMGCSRIDSIVLDQYAVYDNIEERKEKRTESVLVLKSDGLVSNRIF